MQAMCVKVEDVRRPLPQLKEIRDLLLTYDVAFMEGYLFEWPWNNHCNIMARYHSKGFFDTDLPHRLAFLPT